MIDKIMWHENCLKCRKPIGKFTRKKIKEKFPNAKIEWIDEKTAILKS